MDPEALAARRARYLAFRLVPAEAARLIATAGLALCCVVPGLFGRAEARDEVPPVACERYARDAAGTVGCGEGAPLAPAESFVLGVPIDLNTAEAATLMLLPGIGPALSRRIVEDRAQRGPFPELSAVQRVKGIGPTLGARIARYAVVR